MQDTQRQFGRVANQYAISRPHATGESLDAITRLIEPGPYERGLDIATGTGFTAFAIAPYCGKTIAFDLTPEMLNQARRLAGERGLNRLGYMLGDAERLPFSDGALDLVTCRSSAHHFPHVERFVAEVARILRPGGVFVLSDPAAPENDGLAAIMDSLEILRDPSHVHNLRPSEWHRVIAIAGLTIESIEMTHTYQVFDDWVERSGATPEAVAELRPQFAVPRKEVRLAFGIHEESDGIHFAWENIGIRARR